MHSLYIYIKRGVYSILYYTYVWYRRMYTTFIAHIYYKYNIAGQAEEVECIDMKSVLVTVVSLCVMLLLASFLTLKLLMKVCIVLYFRNMYVYSACFNVRLSNKHSDCNMFWKRRLKLFHIRIQNKTNNEKQQETRNNDVC